MAHIFKRTVALLNDLNNLNLVLKKAIEFSSKHQTSLEILYIQEEALFEVPDYFLSDDKIAKEGIDKAKIKAKIEEHLKNLNQTEAHAIFVKVEDTVSQILHYGQEDKTILFISAYHETLTPKLLEKTPYSFWLIKNEDIAYEKIALPLDLQGESKKIIKATKHVFSESEITLLHNYRYLVDTMMVQVDYLNITPIVTTDMVALNEVLKKEKQEILETYKKEFDLKGICVDGDDGALDEELIRYIATHDFDLTVLYHRDTELFLSPSLILLLLEKVDTDFFIFNL